MSDAPNRIRLPQTLLETLELKFRKGSAVRHNGGVPRPQATMIARSRQYDDIRKSISIEAICKTERNVEFAQEPFCRYQDGERRNACLLGRLEGGRGKCEGFARDQNGLGIGLACFCVGGWENQGERRCRRQH